MKRNMLKDYKEQIQDADLVLVGIGRELRADRVIDFKKAITNEHYQNLIDKEDEDSKWMRTVYERQYLLSMKETDLFKELEEVLEGKEYFVVTSNDDGLLYHTHLKKDHVTAPCGNGDFFQCSVPCDEQLYPANLGLRDLIDYYEKTGKIEHLECPKCGKQLIFNVRTEETKSIYIEGAYLNSWASYTKWLQNTLNKKLFILELGEGFEVPSLFRWPFEKMAFYNEKATFVRVHHSLYQIGKEIKEKGIGIKMDSRDFLNIAHE
jgi:NAD-dependent SIR2 family protein deacetylase